MRKLKPTDTSPVTALLDVRVLPWRLRPRMMKVDTVRHIVDTVADPSATALEFADSGGLVFGFALWLALIVAAPLIVVLLAALLLSIELPIVIAIALVLVIIRFAGVVPWTVVTIDNISRTETYESYRSIFRALHRIREINGDRRVHVRWAWSAATAKE